MMIADGQRDADAEADVWKLEISFVLVGR